MESDSRLDFLNWAQATIVPGVMTCGRFRSGSWGSNDFGWRAPWRDSGDHLSTWASLVAATQLGESTRRKMLLLPSRPA